MIRPVICRYASVFCILLFVVRCCFGLPNSREKEACRLLRSLWASSMSRLTAWPGPLLANTFMRSLEEKQQKEGQMPSYLQTICSRHICNHAWPPSSYLLSWCSELETPLLKLHHGNCYRQHPCFPGMNISKNGTRLSTSVWRKPTNTVLYLYYGSHVEKGGLLKTMLYRAYRLSSTWKTFTDECEFLKTTFAQLRYPTLLIDSKIKAFIHDQTINKRSRVSHENCKEENYHHPVKRSKIGRQHKKTASVPEQQKRSCAYDQFSQPGK